MTRSDAMKRASPISNAPLLMISNFSRRPSRAKAAGHAFCRYRRAGRIADADNSPHFVDIRYTYSPPCGVKVPRRRELGHRHFGQTCFTPLFADHATSACMPLMPI